MKTVFVLASLLTTLLMGGCSPFNDGQKDADIAQLRMELVNQQGAHAADLVLAERQAAIYMGCKQFFDLCSQETRAQGQKLVSNGFTGATSGWYWLGFLAMPVCIAATLGAFLAVLFAASGFLQLKLIEPKRELVTQKQLLIDTAEQRVKAANLRANELEKANGIRRKEIHQLTHPRKVRFSTVVTPAVIPDKKDSGPELPVTQEFVRPDEF
jgi:hypothetical protein